ncbi:hypothetical protein L6452_36386 [Arctium lappa]|uniref:Uncharacterized protein n=1 Tax=Arctium lappa TaxID=4217 RepID=A0ACB8Y9Y5_ARCLA|nr:hypothetical protein L6452_36386 [Arctium lappa]
MTTSCSSWTWHSNDIYKICLVGITDVNDAIEKVLVHGEGTNISEYVSCQSYGRTLFQLQVISAEIRAKSSLFLVFHLLKQGWVRRLTNEDASCCIAREDNYL